MAIILIILLTVSGIKFMSYMLGGLAGTLNVIPKEPCKGHEWTWLDDKTLWCKKCEKSFNDIIS